MKKCSSILVTVSLLILFSGCREGKQGLESNLKPNIVWIIVEDMSSHFGYQGEVLVKTPNVDRLAKEGVVYRNAYVTAPVCSASRSAMITGMYQTSIGAHHHRSSRGTEKIYLPKDIKTLPELFKEAGYYCANGQEKIGKKGKEDYNFSYDSKRLYNGTDWKGRAAGQPFFAQIQLRGGKLRNVPKWQEEVLAGLDAEQIISPDQVTLPPYYPNNPVFLKDWADYLNNVQYSDQEVGKIMSRLKQDGLLDNTVVFFITDHGISQARGKQFLYDEGSKIPFIVWAPKKLRPEIKDELIIHIDMAATSLDLAGIEIPDYMEARSLLNEKYTPREFIVSARDRCDETVDHMRMLRRGNFKYIKNYLPNRPYLQPCAYKDGKPWMSVLWDLDASGKLNETQKLVTAQTRQADELYDLSVDPFEINNLADDSKYASILKGLREALDQWVFETGDQGQFPEPDEMYDSDMSAYVKAIERKNNEEAEIIKENIALMKEWALEGK
ncbi:MAG: sulfatase [Maribacter sp.]|nr:sulfatase [Maribacter sp.]